MLASSPLIKVSRLKPGSINGSHVSRKSRTLSHALSDKSRPVAVIRLKEKYLIPYNTHEEGSNKIACDTSDIKRVLLLVYEMGRMSNRFEMMHASNATNFQLDKIAKKSAQIL